MLADILFVVSIVISLLVFAWLELIVYRFACESERLIKMLLQMPVSVLESVEEIKAFVEQGDSLTEAKAEHQKAQQEQQTKDILEACEDAVVVCNRQTTIEIVNPTAERMTGYTAAELLGSSLVTVLPEAVGTNRKILKKMRKGDDHGAGSSKATKLSQEVVIKSKNGSQFTSLATLSRTMVGSKITFALFIRDITEMKKREEEMVRQQQRAEALLCNILPCALVSQISGSIGPDGEFTSSIIAQAYEEATVLFADIVGFTPMSSGMKPEDLVGILHSLFSELDKLCLDLGVEKIKTIGDCYLACSGVPTPFPEHAEAMLEFAIGIQQKLKAFNRANKTSIQMRIGINTGPLVAGVLGLQKFMYDVWGDAVVIAGRMESSGFPGRIQVSESTFLKVKDHGYRFQSRGKVQIKDKPDVEGYLFEEETAEAAKHKVARHLERGGSALASMVSSVSFGSAPASPGQ
jgi:PAS domain S-box-containing protein